MQVLEQAFTPAVFLKTEMRNQNTAGISGVFEIDTPDGMCLGKETTHSYSDFSISDEVIRERCMRELTLVPGIGPKRADRKSVV